MGKQSSRIYYQGKDHKEIYFNGHYHKAMYIGSQLVWKKLQGLIYKTYIDSFRTPDTTAYPPMWAQNGSMAIWSYNLSNILYITTDFLEIQEIEFDSPIDSVGFTNGLFGVLSGGQYYTSEDGVNWSKKEVLLFYTNNFSGTIDTGQRKIASDFVIINDVAYAFYETVSDEYEEKADSETNDYAHELVGLYHSTDFKTWTSLNTMYHMYEIEEVVKVLTYASYSMPVFKGYVDGNYYFYCFEYYIQNDSLISKGRGFYKSTDMVNISEIIENISSNTEVVQVGNGFYVSIDGESLGYTNDFVNYTHILFDINNKVIGSTGAYGVSYTHTITLNDEELKNGIEYKGYIFSNVKCTVSTISNTGSSYTEVCYCTVISEANNLGKVVDIVHGIVTGYYDYSLGTIIEKKYEYTTGQNRFMYIDNKSIFAIPTSNANHYFVTIGTVEG